MRRVRHIVETLYFWEATSRAEARVGHKPVLFLHGGVLKFRFWNSRMKSVRRRRSKEQRERSGTSARARKDRASTVERGPKERTRE